MGDSELQFSEWVEERLARLAPESGWRPNAVRALARLRELDRARHIRRLRWIWASAATFVAGIAAIVLLSPQACATPRLCVQSAWNVVHGKPPHTAAPALAPTPSYKQSGSPDAPIRCDIYSDYECPACARLHLETVPMLAAEYVQTGKLFLTFRDFPLPQHTYSRLAARYANAAGRLGHYDSVSMLLFATQAAWMRNGDIEGQLRTILGTEAASVKRLAADPELDAIIDADVERGRRDGLTHTPTVVVEFEGKRQTLPGVPDYRLLKGYLDTLLAR
jgi:protein-disulfide isomerase